MDMELENMQPETQPEQIPAPQPEQIPAPQPVDAQMPQQPVYQQPMYQQPVYQQPMYRQPVYQQPMYQQPVYQQPMYQQPVYQQPMYQQPVYQQPMYQQPVPQKPVEDDRIPDYRFPLATVLLLAVSIAYSIFALIMSYFTTIDSWGLLGSLPMVLMLVAACTCRVRRNKGFGRSLILFAAFATFYFMLTCLADFEKYADNLLYFMAALLMITSFVGLAICYFIGRPGVKVLKLCFALASLVVCAGLYACKVVVNLYMPPKFFLELGLEYVLGLLPVNLAILFYTPFKK